MGLEIGSRVVIKSSSEYYNKGPSNPDEMVQGTILSILPQEGCLPVNVQWDNLCGNSYNKYDLQLYEEYVEYEIEDSEVL